MSKKETEKLMLFHGKKKHEMMSMGQARRYMALKKGKGEIIVKKGDKVVMTNKDMKESKLRNWLEEELKTTPEQRNWKSIEPKMDAAIGNLVQIAKSMVTKKGDNDKELRKLIGNLKTLKTRIGMDARS